MRIKAETFVILVLLAFALLAILGCTTKGGDPLSTSGNAATMSTVIGQITNGHKTVLHTPRP